MTREAAHVKLVEDGLGKGPIERLIALPVVTGGIGHDALHRHRGVVARPARGQAIVRIGNRYCEPVRIEEDLFGIEPKTTFRCERPMRAVRIDLPLLEARHQGMPVVIGPVRLRIERDDLCRRCGTLVIEQQQLDQRGVL